jgi:hypothetical protein
VTDRSDWPAGQPTGNALDPDSPGRWDGSCTLGLVASRCAASSTRTSSAHKIMQTPRDEIEASLPAHRIVNADVTVMVKSDGTKLGELLISKGSFDWRPSKHQTSYRMTWEKFARIMEESART